MPPAIGSAIALIVKSRCARSSSMLPPRSGSTSTCQLPPRATTRHEPNSSERAKQRPRPRSARYRARSRRRIAVDDDVDVDASLAEQAIAHGAPDQPRLCTRERVAGRRPSARSCTTRVRRPGRVERAGASIGVPSR